MIVFTSDHGDHFGDHSMGEKVLFHEVSVGVPLIICDPRPIAYPTRGAISDAFVEAIDLVLTFLDKTGAPSAYYRLEGRSLEPILHGQTIMTGATLSSRKSTMPFMLPAKHSARTPPDSASI